MSEKDLEAQVLHRLALARACVLEKADYYAHTLLNMTPVIVNRGTMGVTPHLVLYVSPQWFFAKVPTDAKCAGLLVHECEHPLRGVDRIAALPNQELANYAADVAINADAREEGWELPDGGVYPETYGLPPGKTLEWYYEKLQEMCDQSGQSIKGMTAAIQNKKAGKSQSGEKPPWQPGIAAGACGGVAGNPLDPELEAELDAQYGKSPAEVEAIRRQTLEAIEQHIQQHGRGSVPGRFEELIKTKIKPPDVNWRQKLRMIARRVTSLIAAGGRDYSLRRPSMSSAYTGALMSGLVDYPLIAAVVVDTSGSMGEKQLADAHNETFHIARKVTTDKIWLLHVDTHIQRCEQVRAAQVPKLSFKGRGGTDFRLAIQHLQKLRPRPNVVIYITDGDGIAPPNPPKGMDVIWCVIRTPYARMPALWGHIVVCDKNQTLRAPVLSE